MTMETSTASAPMTAASSPACRSIRPDVARGRRVVAGTGDDALRARRRHHRVERDHRWARVTSNRPRLPRDDLRSPGRQRGLTASLSLDQILVEELLAAKR